MRLDEVMRSDAAEVVVGVKAGLASGEGVGMEAGGVMSSALLVATLVIGGAECVEDAKDAEMLPMDNYIH